MRRVSLDETELEADVRGSGEPVVLIQTALVADELRPLAAQPPLRDQYQLIVYHRRGYAGSGPVKGPGSFQRDATDCHDLLAALGVERAHIVGVSYSAAVALQLAATVPARVHSLGLIEPPPVHIPSADQFLAANAQLLDDYSTQGVTFALDRFLTRVIGPNWRGDLERECPVRCSRSSGTQAPSSGPISRRYCRGASGPRMHGACTSLVYRGQRERPVVR